MSPALTLSGDVPGLLRRGSPVSVRIEDADRPGVYTMPDDRKPSMRHGPHLVAPVDEWPDDYEGTGAMARSCRDDELTLDLTDPTGRYHALLWLRERGHELRWAEDEAEVLAWSVLSVVRGGGPIIGILAVWTEGAPNSAANYVRENVPESGHAGLLVWHKNALWMLDKPCGQSPEDRAASDRAALAAGYALRSDDGTLTLPPLPEVPRG